MFICIQASISLVSTHYIGQVKADALLSLHAISGCDTTGRFLGKGKTSWWNGLRDMQ